MAKILVVDDADGVRHYIGRVLEHAGHVFEESSDGAAALSLLQESNGAFDLVLTDIKMPVMDGIALALAIAKQWPDMPIVMMTGYADQQERAVGLDSLIREVITKPFTMKQLISVISDALETR